MSFDGCSDLRPQEPERFGCAYCGRRDAADYAGNCNGCGAPKAAGVGIDVTTLLDVDRCYLLVRA